MYLCMFSLYRDYDDIDNLGVIANRIKMPDNGYDEYPPGSSVNETYPDAHHFQTSTNHASKLAFDIEVQGAVPDDFRSWVQSGSGSRKFYMSIIGQRDSFGILEERVPLSVLTNDTFTMETWIAPTVEDSMNPIKLWRGAVEPAGSGATGKPSARSPATSAVSWPPSA